MHVDLPAVVLGMDELTVKEQQLIMDAVFRALPLEQIESKPSADEEEEEEEQAVAAANDKEEEEDDDDDYVPPLQHARRSCITNQLSSSAETKEDYKLSQLEAHHQLWD